MLSKICVGVTIHSSSALISIFNYQEFWDISDQLYRREPCSGYCALHILVAIQCLAHYNIYHLVRPD
jgi:hypothetical protein